MEGFQSLLILMVVVWVSGKVFRYLSLPVLFGELLGGLLVGPVFLNLIDPSNELIQSLSELGVFFLMLHTGLETNPKNLFKATKKSFIIAVTSLIVMYSLSLIIIPYFGFSFQETLFIATGISATAIAISSRVLKEFKLKNTKISDTVIGTEIINEILLLVIFSIVLQLILVGSLNFIQLTEIILKIIFFFAVVIIGGHYSQKHLQKFLENKGFTLTLITALSLSVFAEWIGLHFIIGAFLAGLFIREEAVDEKVFEKIEDRVYGISYSFLGPIFFATLAFSLDFEGLIVSTKFFLALLLLAILGKFFGTAIPAKFQKFSFQDSAIIGLAMNCRGVIDLIIASIGLQLGIIDKTVFSILVSIAFLSTLFAIIGTKTIILLKKQKS